MNSIRASIFGLFVAAAVGTLVGCGSSSSTPTQVVVPPSVKSQAVALQTVVQDAATGLPVAPAAPEKVTLVVYGADANKVVDINGVSLYSAANGFAGPVTASNGLFTLYFNPGTPVPAQMSLRLVASAKSFVNSSSDLVIKSTDLHTDGTTTPIDVSITMVSQTAPPPSVTVVTAPIAVTNGTTPAAVSTNKTPESTVVVGGATVSLGSATVAIPATTTVYADAAKTVPLPAGTTTVNITYNNNTTATSLATFPGGLTISQSATGAPLATPSVFVTGGFASVEVISTAPNGTVTKAKTFDKPISVTIPVPKGTINPRTGLPVAAGDATSVWSYDSTTGAWSVLKLTNGTIVTGILGALDTSNNTFPVAFVTDHLTYFSTGDVLAPTQQCSNAAITIAGAAGNMLNISASRVGGGWSDQGTLDANTAKPATALFTIGSAPTGQAVVTAYQGSNLVGTVTVSDLCASGNTLPVTPAAVPTSALNVTVRDVCNNSTTSPSPFTPRPGVTVNATIVGGSDSALTGTNGIATFTSLTVGATYTISVGDPFNYTNGYTVLSTGNSISVDRGVTCQIVTGT